MQFTIDLKSDVAAHCAEHLINAGYSPPAHYKDVLELYLEVKNRRVASIPRLYHTSGYSVSEELEKGHSLLKAKIIAGDDIWPHQSRKILKDSYEDGMLNDFGIQHFHLGTTFSQAKPELIEGTSDLLFAFVTDTEFYAIGIYNHLSWSRTELLDIVHKHWPHLTEPYSLKPNADGNHSKLAYNYSDAEILELRKAGINAFTTRTDGTVTMGLGGGITGAKTSVKVFRELMKTLEYLDQLEHWVLKNFEDALLADSAATGGVVRLVWHGCYAHAVSIPEQFELPLNDYLIFPAI